MASNKEISRAGFLARAGAVGVAGAMGPLLTGGGARAAGAPGGAGSPVSEPAPGRTGGRRGLTYRGVSYELIDGETPFTGWDATRMRHDMRAIKDELHADSVSVFGTGVERLAATSTEAAERGLHVWLQPRLADVPQPEILDHLAETGRHAERLRRQGAEVHLSVGAEFMLFVPGIVPGANAVERIKNLTSGHYDPKTLVRELRSFTVRAAKAARSVFHGKVTYGAAQDEQVDWKLFDLVSVNYYASFARRAEHVRALSKFRRWGKPVVVSEFGTCTFRGAPERGGMGWDVVDYDREPPEIIGELVRSERTQAAYLTDLVDVFESMDLYAALVYQFVTPDAPHRHRPRYDLDMASYSLVKPIWKTPEEPTAHWHWEPKEAFHALARHYGRARC
ncbi:abortive phage infection protein [Streptomyces sp. NA02950]|uniref:abortive phage infection protein n=1 Tax=Streptomyces sp. NA02950 TaxID=2742137 RepID=UPI0015916F99|nr:abortive phage infection protein [Streptomyces sp. NA02950]QKV91236.1 abortive phage infection protein [Streptomyces sp. NA02950]